jgi:hypothetical protein
VITGPAIGQMSMIDELQEIDLAQDARFLPFVAHGFIVRTCRMPHTRHPGGRARW